MNHANPTPLTVGAKGALHGWRVTVAARMVLGMEDGGETWYWNEFYLVGDNGNRGTLVYEETEHGPEWKLFREFQPATPLTAREAARKRVGDTVTLDSTPMRITLVDQSRVYHLEGTAPEGVEIGDVANYFNCDAGERMLVASWTGDDIEFYEGQDVPDTLVAQAFGFPPPVATSFVREGAATSASSGRSNAFSIGVVIILALVTLFAAFACVGGVRRARQAVPAKKAAPAVQLAPGATGRLAGELFTVEDRTVVGIARVAGRHDRRDYRLLTAAREPALLVQSLNGNPSEWHLFRPANPPADLAEVPAYAAAALRRGAAVTVDGRALRVAELFQVTPSPADGRPKPDYGWVARDAETWVVARWNETTLEFLRGRPVPEAEVLAALGPKSP
jgi:hypothetical protein